MSLPIISYPNAYLNYTIYPVGFGTQESYTLREPLKEDICSLYHRVNDTCHIAEVSLKCQEINIQDELEQLRGAEKKALLSIIGMVFSFVVSNFLVLRKNYYPAVLGYAATVVCLYEFNYFRNKARRNIFEIANKLIALHENKKVTAHENTYTTVHDPAQYHIEIFTPYFGSWLGAIRSRF